LPNSVVVSVRAVGVRPAQLIRTVGGQAALIAALGYLVGAGLAYAAQFLIRDRLGDVTIAVTPAMLAQDVRQRGKHPKVRERSLGRFVTLGVEQDRAEFQRGVVGDAILPVVRNAARGRVLQVALRNQPQVPDFFRAGLVALQPAGAEPDR
jgi:hypothetical protein